MPDVWVRYRGGEIGKVPESELYTYQTQLGVTPLSDDEVRAASIEQTRERRWGDRPVAATALGVARGVSAGLTDVAAEQFGYGESVRQIKERNPGLSTTGEIVGGAGAVLASGGSSLGARALAATPAAIAERAGLGVASRLGEGILARAAGHAVEGGLIGAGVGAGEIALSEDPVSFEQGLSTIGTNALIGAGVGAGASVASSVVGKAAAKGFDRARAALDDMATRAERQASTPIVDELIGYQEARQASDVYQLADATSKSSFAQGNRMMRDIPLAPEDAAKNPARYRRALEKERSALRTIAAQSRDDVLGGLAKEDRAVARAVSREIDLAKPTKKTFTLKGSNAAKFRDLNGLGDEFAEGVEKAGSGSLKVTRAEAQEFVDRLNAGELAGLRAQAYDKVPALLRQNEALIASIDAASAPAKKSLIEELVVPYAVSAAGGFLPGGIVGAVGAMVAPRAIRAAGELLSGRLGNASREAALRTTKAIEMIMATGRKAAPAVVPSATRILTGAKYGDAPAREDNARPPRSKLVAAFRERERELRSQTRLEGGAIKMTRAARTRVADRLRGVAAVDPVAADRIESHVARRVEFLASKLPKRPESAAIRVGPDTWEPSEFQARQFARYVAAVEDPGAVEERIASGTVTPEDAEAYRSVYPERFAAFQMDVLARLPLLRETLPYARRLSLSILFGVPVDAAMHPRIVARLQSQFAEDGTAGGENAPIAKPNFGSLGSASAAPGTEPTAAQERTA